MKFSSHKECLAEVGPRHYFTKSLPRDGSLLLVVSHLSGFKLSNKKNFHIAQHPLQTIYLLHSPQTSMGPGDGVPTKILLDCLSTRLQNKTNFIGGTVKKYKTKTFQKFQIPGSPAELNPAPAPPLLLPRGDYRIPWCCSRHTLYRCQAGSRKI